MTVDGRPLGSAQGKLQTDLEAGAQGSRGAGEQHGGVERSTCNVQPANSTCSLVVGHWSLVILLGLAFFALWVIWPKVVSSVWANLGTVELSRAMVGGDTSGLEPAQAYLERATQWDAGHGLAYRNLGRVAAFRGDLSTAMEALTRATETLPKDVWAHLELGDAQWDLGRKDEAVNSWVRAASVDPTVIQRLEQEGPAESGRFATYSEYNQILEIVAEAAVKAHPGRAYPYLVLGWLARDRGDYPEATRWFSLAAQVDRGSHEPLRELGIVAERQGRYDLAAAYFRQAIEREPRQPCNYSALAHTYATRREFDLAAEWYQRALALYPDSAGDHYGLAQAYYQLGRYADALAEYRQVLSLDPGNQASQAQVAVLERMLSEGSTK